MITLGNRNKRPKGVFDALRLKRMDRNRLHAWVEFSDRDGRLREHEFEGTRDEIRAMIEHDADLLKDEKCHLLQSLGLSGICDSDTSAEDSFTI